MSIAAIILNILILVFEVYAIIISKPEQRHQMLAYYTVLSNLATMISSVLLLIFGPRSFPVLLRYLSTCMMTMTFIVTVCVLVPMGGGLKKLLFSGTGLFHHLICPILCLVSYVFFETHSRMWAVPVILTFVYGMIMLWLNHTGKVDGPYPFFRVGRQSVRATVLWMAVLTCAITAISVILS